MIFLRAFLVLFLMNASASLAAKKFEAPASDGAYVLIEVGSLEDAVIKGASLPGSIIFAQYDPDSKDLALNGSKSGGKTPALLATRASTTKPIAKSKSARLYLVQLLPGKWVIEGANGTSFSLGRKSFNIEAGQVIDLGFMKPKVDRLEGEEPKSQASAFLSALTVGSMKPKDERPVRLEMRARTQSDLALPPGLLNVPLSQPSYEEDKRFGNHLGGLVNRIGGRASRPTEQLQMPPAP
jgi:hypothetical protein